VANIHLFISTRQLADTLHTHGLVRIGVGWLGSVSLTHSIHSSLRHCSSRLWHSRPRVRVRHQYCLNCFNVVQSVLGGSGRGIVSLRCLPIPLFLPLDSRVASLASCGSVFHCVVVCWVSIHNPIGTVSKNNRSHRFCSPPAPRTHDHTASRIHTSAIVG
jgi:hypothetical protein